MPQTLTVTGMSCEHCEQTVQEALEAVDGVASATADHESEQATVDGDAEPDTLIEAVEDAGYEAKA
ncbi:Copper chaperone [Halorhabdus sp. SVX81]|uniref:heavy-metal-associated domain-containing protein n=1 Tax=Halorhabdus sp. SVX81 TaxID=2978283 RepID=UPI0023D98B23|nr:heavy metal-associated domain-containing protein [Halorhabdus sp. SVX81]WEL17328.1 Copper chaperone [Halorhabdus sp. SVX81]